MRKDPSASEMNLQELIETKKRLSNTKYILFTAIIAGPAYMFLNVKIGAIILMVLIGLWAVTTYIAFMHYLSAKKRNQE